MRVYYPHLFQTEKPSRNRRRSMAVESPAQSARALQSLPTAARDTFKRLVGQGVFKDNDEDRKFYHDEYINS